MKRSHAQFTEDRTITDMDKFLYYSEMKGKNRGVLLSNQQIKKIRERKNLTVVKLGGGLLPEQISALPEGVRIIEFIPTFFTHEQINVSQFKILMSALPANVRWISLPISLALQIYPDINAILSSIPANITVYSSPDTADVKTVLLRAGTGQDPLSESEIEQISQYKIESASTAKRVKQSPPATECSSPSPDDGFNKYYPPSSGSVPVQQHTPPLHPMPDFRPLQPRANIPSQPFSFFPASKTAAQQSGSMPSIPESRTPIVDLENKYKQALIYLNNEAIQRDHLMQQLQEREEQVKFYKAQLQKRDYELSQFHERVSTVQNEFGIVRYNLSNNILPKAQKRFEELKDKNRELKLLVRAKSSGYPLGYSPKFYAASGNKMKQEQQTNNDNDRFDASPSSS